jgi:hypothetical protein
LNSDDNPIETGLTEQERKAISERVLFEVQLRKELESDNLNRRQRLRRWLESNLALLVVGSLISSLLVPYFQQKQEVIRWQKQNQYDNLKYKLERMRSALEECLTLAAHAAAINNISKTTLANPRLDAEAYRRFDSDLHDIQQKRFEQVTKVMSLLIYFKDPAAIRTPYQQYLNEGMLLTEEITRLGADTIAETQNKPPDVQKWKALQDRAMAVSMQATKLNGSFENVIQAIRRQIEERERENETFQ